MKYVRTKDGKIHDFLGKYKDEFGFYYLDTNKEDKYRCDNNYYKDCKEADTIKELCDEFVIALGNGTHRFIRSLSGKGKGGITWYRQRNYKIVAIYGAIWTDKGLIYVAKMNDKGELELL